MRAALDGLKGIKSVDVPGPGKPVTVQFSDKGEVSLDDIMGALKKAGYKATAA